jgi:hypothetical protein
VKIIIKLIIIVIFVSIFGTRGKIANTCRVFIVQNLEFHRAYISVSRMQADCMRESGAVFLDFDSSDITRNFRRCRVLSIFFSPSMFIYKPVIYVRF